MTNKILQYHQLILLKKSSTSIDEFIKDYKRNSPQNQGPSFGPFSNQQQIDPSKNPIEQLQNIDQKFQVHLFNLDSYSEQDEMFQLLQEILTYNIFFRIIFIFDTENQCLSFLDSSNSTRHLVVSVFINRNNNDDLMRVLFNESFNQFTPRSMLLLRQKPKEKHNIKEGMTSIERAYFYMNNNPINPLCNIPFKEYTQPNFHQQILNKNVDVVRGILQAEFVQDSNRKNERNQLPLHLLCQNPIYEEFIERMVAITHNVESLDDFGYAPIHYAAMCGFQKAIEMINRKNTKSKDGESFLLCAGWAGQINIITNNEEINLGFQKSEYEENICHYAALNGNKIVLEYIKQKANRLLTDENKYNDLPINYGLFSGMNIDYSNLIDNRRNQLNESYHFFAALRNNYELLKKGVGLNEMRNKFGSPLYFYCLIQGDLKLMKFFRIDFKKENNNKETVWEMALKSKNPNCFSQLVDENETDKDYGCILHEQIKNKNIFNFKKILTSKIDINLQDNQKKTALHYALEIKNFEMVQQLMQFGARLDIKDLEGKTSFHLLCKSEFWKLLQFQQGNLALNIQDNDGNTPLMISLLDKNKDLLMMLITWDQNFDLKNKKGDYALSMIIENELFSALDILLNKNINLNQQNSKGETPLMQIIKKQKFNYLTYLIQRGVDVNVYTENGDTLLMYVIRNDLDFIINDLFNARINVNQESQDKQTAIYVAIEKKKYNLLGYFFNKQLDVNKKDKNGNPLMHVLFEQNQFQFFQTITQMGYDLFAKDKDGQNLLHRQIILNRLESVRNLLSFINQDIPNDKKQTSLQIALEYEHLEIAVFLYEYGGDVNAQNSNGENLLFLALRKSDINLISRLLNDQRCNLDAQNKKQETALHICIQLKFFQGFQILIQSRANRNLFDKNGQQPIHLVAQHGLTEFMLMMINMGENLNALTSLGNSPLNLSIMKSQKEMSSLLLSQQQINPEIENQNGENSFYMSCQYNDEETFQKLIQRTNINHTNYEGITPLMIVSKKGFIKLAQQLVSLNCDLNIECKNNKSALYYSISNKNFNIADLLIQNGVSIEQPVGGENLIEHFCEKGSQPEICFLIQRGCNLKVLKINQPFLHQAIQLNWEHVVSHLIQRKDVDVEEYHLEFPIFKMLSHNMNQQVQELIQRGIDKNVVNKDGESVLKVVSFSQKDQLMKILIQNGFNINEIDSKGNSLLMQLIIKKLIPQAVILIENNADLNVQNSKGTALIASVEINSIQLVEILLQKGADIHLTNEFNQTALHCACKKEDNLEIVKLLISGGGNPNVLDVFGNSPFLESIFCQQLNVISFLLQNGPNVNTINKEQENGLHICTQLGNVEIAKLLLRNQINVNQQNAFGQTPFHKSVTLKNQQISSLLSPVTDPNLKDQQGNTPLLISLMNGFQNDAEILMSKGADLKDKNMFGNNGLFCAILGENEEFFFKHFNSQFVFERNVNLDTGLHISVKSEKMLKITKYIIQHGGEVEATNLQKQMPLHIASIYGCEEQLKELLKKTNFIDQQDSDGNTALHLSFMYKNIKTTKALLKKGASQLILNRANKSPIQQGIESNDEKFIQEIQKFIDNGMKDWKYYYCCQIMQFIFIYSFLQI